MSSSIFNLKWKKHSSPLDQDEENTENENDTEEDTEIAAMIQVMESTNLTEFQSQIVAYICGFLIRKLEKKISCLTCFNFLTHQESESMANQSALQLIASKQRGGLKVPSMTVVKLVTTCEKMFRVYVSGKEGDQFKNHKNISLFLMSQISRMNHDVNFDLGDHDLVTSCQEEDIHSTQLKKSVCQKYIQLRLLTYGQKYYTEVLQGNKSGRKQKLNRTAIFENL